jgi:hypothetical protein
MSRRRSAKAPRRHIERQRLRSFSQHLLADGQPRVSGAFQRSGPRRPLRHPARSLRRGAARRFERVGWWPRRLAAVALGAILPLLAGRAGRHPAPERAMHGAARCRARAAPVRPSEQFTDGPSRVPIIEQMTIERMEHVGIVVEDRADAVAFFATLGLELQGEAPVGGRLGGRHRRAQGVRRPDRHPAEPRWARTTRADHVSHAVDRQQLDARGGERFGHPPRRVRGQRH